jgi:Tfp pilus assembly protein PilF
VPVRLPRQADHHLHHRDRPRHSRLKSATARPSDAQARQRLDIRPELYDLWLDALLLSISAHDKAGDGDTRQAWREVLNKGIAVIKTGY